MSIPALCLIVPCYNEEEMLPTFFEKVVPFEFKDISLP